MKKFIQIFLDRRMMTGIKTIRVATIAIKVYNKEAPIIRKAMTKAATANAIPTA